MPDGPYVFGWLADRTGCGYYRLMLPVGEYIARGHPGAYGTGLDRYTRMKAEVFIGQRVLGEGPTEAWQQMAREGNRRMIFEVDDDLWNIDPSSPAVEAYTPRYQDNMRRNIEVADAVTVTTVRLAERVSVWNAHVRIVPNRVPAALTRAERAPSDGLTIGWTGSASHVVDWRDAGPQIGRFLRRNPGVGFHTMGFVADEMRDWPLKITRWTNSIEEYYSAIDFDIGVIPLWPTTFNRSKSNIKALEFAALGIPVVASAFDPYEDFVRHGETGFLVRQEHEWGKYLRVLVEDEPMREEMGRAARKLAGEHTVEGNLDGWRAVWEGK